MPHYLLENAHCYAVNYTPTKQRIASIHEIVIKKKSDEKKTNYSSTMNLHTTEMVKPLSILNACKKKRFPF